LRQSLGLLGTGRPGRALKVEGGVLLAAHPADAARVKPLQIVKTFL
jgi:hypothetical protein